MKDRGQAWRPDRAIRFVRSLCSQLRSGWCLETDEILPDEQVKQQSKRVLVFCLAMGVWVPVFAGIYQIVGQPRAVDILAVAGLLLSGIAGLVCATERPRLCGNLMVALGVGVYTALAVVTGGPTSPVTQWYVSLPVLAFLLVGLRWGILWTGVTLAVISGLFVARALGWEFTSEFSAAGLEFLEWSAVCGIVACIAALTIVFKVMEHRHEAAIKEALVRAKAADRAKSEFLANMSHEIRTPLTAILGYTELLLATDKSGTQDGPINGDEALSTIHRNGQHLLQVINDILDLSKIEAGMLVVERTWLSPRQLIEEVASLMHVRAAAKNLHLDTSFGEGFPDEIETDPTRLRQVLLNVVGNGIKFTESGVVSIHASAEPAAVVFTVTDSGIVVVTTDDEPLIGSLSDDALRFEMEADRRGGGA